MLKWETSGEIQWYYSLLSDLVDKVTDLSADTVSSYLCLYTVNYLIDLIVGEVNSDNTFNSLDRVIFEFFSEVLVVLDFVYEFFDFCFDIHSGIPSFL